MEKQNVTYTFFCLKKYALSFPEESVKNSVDISLKEVTSYNRSLITSEKKIFCHKNN